jgi:F420-dependent oxidoreductase-like protein
LRVSFKTPPQMTDWPSMRDLWVTADDIDVYDAAWTFDHFYPIGSNDQSGPCLEGWTILSVLAGLTKRLRLGVLVSANLYRHPALLANMAATLDVASEGRLEIGLGAGWNQMETAAYGLDLPALTERFDRLAEACEIIDSMLTKPTTTFSGRYYQLTDARCEPKPVQSPRPPIVIGGGGERRTLRIAARWADQWNLPGGTLDVFRHKLQVLREHCLAVGRDTSAVEPSIQIPAGDPNATADAVAEYAEAGARHVVLIWRAPFDLRVLEPMAVSLRAIQVA